MGSKSGNQSSNQGGQGSQTSQGNVSNQGNDGLSNQEQSDIGDELGLSGDASAANDAYLLLKVPDFGNTSFVNDSAAEALPDPRPTGWPEGQTLEISGDAPNPNVLESFLRLGAFDYSAEPPAARELLKMIPQGNAASNPATSAATNILSSVADFPVGHIFVDDIRDRAQDKGLTGAEDPDHGLSKTDRQAESSLLYSRGGWRDHSDGNRISTTWGDKVEVVRGNYKMIVMGRQNNPEQSMGWEASGAHIQDFAPGTMPGASYWLEWIDDDRYYAPDGEWNESSESWDNDTEGVPGFVPGQKGVWLLVNTTENVYEYARNAGNFREEVWGDVNESYVGSENPPSSGSFATDKSQGTEGHKIDDTDKISGRNYDLPGTSGNVERSTPQWDKDNAGMVRSNPHVIEKTWAQRIDSYTGTKNWSIPTIREYTFADSIKSYTGTIEKACGVIQEETWAAAKTEVTMIAGAMAGTTNVGGNITESTLAGTIIGNTAAGLIVDMTEALVLNFELNLGGVHIEVEGGGGHINIEGGLLAFELFACIGKLEIDICKTAEITVIDHWEYKSKKDKATLQSTLSALRISESYLQSDTIAVEAQMKTLSAVVSALKVQLGS